GFRQRFALVHAGTGVADIRKPGVLDQTLALLNEPEHFGAVRTRIHQRVWSVAGGDFFRHAEVTQDFAGDQPLTLNVGVNAVAGEDEIWITAAALGEET